MRGLLPWRLVQTLNLPLGVLIGIMRTPPDKRSGRDASSGMGEWPSPGHSLGDAFNLGHVILLVASQPLPVEAQRARPNVYPGCLDGSRLSNVKQ